MFRTAIVGIIGIVRPGYIDNDLQQLVVGRGEDCVFCASSTGRRRRMMLFEVDQKNAENKDTWPYDLKLTPFMLR